MGDEKRNTQIIFLGMLLKILLGGFLFFKRFKSPLINRNIRRKKLAKMI